MGSKIFAFGTLVVVGLIIADVLIHPTGTSAAANGATQLSVPTISGLLGGHTVQTASTSASGG